MRVLLADDHTIVRQALRALLQAERGFEVVGEVGDGREAVEAARRLRPEAVVMDLAMPGLNGIEATRKITAGPDCPRVVILSMYADVEHIVHALQAGASGYVRKQDADTELVAALLTGTPGNPFLTPSVDRKLVEEHLRRARATGGEEEKGYQPLTGREREVLQLVAEGKANKQIARRLSIAVRTVEAHRASIMRKLNLEDQAGLVRYAVRTGMVAMEE
jgi:two-component system response regulator NreC